MKVKIYKLCLVLGILATGAMGCKKEESPNPSNSTNTPSYASVADAKTAGLTLQQILDNGFTAKQIYDNDIDDQFNLYGLNYKGGKIFYYQGGNVFVVSSKDFEDVEWGCGSSDRFAQLGDNVPGTSQSLFQGKVNTDSILKYCKESNTAAKLCADLVEGGYDDWYLPSVREMYYLRLQRGKVGMYDINPKTYWTSSQAPGTTFRPHPSVPPHVTYPNAYRFVMNGTQGIISAKDSPLYVRAIRSFYDGEVQ